jgi:glycosyltransferase involved in cell wall biosynthesis
MAQPQIRRLVIVSHVAHYEYDGRLYAYGPYAREIDIWADLFPEVGIASPLRHESPPKDCIAFERPNIYMIPQLETGGDSIGAKISQLALLPVHIAKLSAAFLKADAIHVRCPGNLGLLGAILAPLFTRRLVAKYAGNWGKDTRSARTFGWQRKILSSRWWRKGVVTVYGECSNQPKQIVPFFTSMMTERQVQAAAGAAKRKTFGSPVQVLYSGRLAPGKGVDLLIQASRLLAGRGFSLELTILGDGPERPALEELSRRLGVQQIVRFIGAKPFDQVMSEYEKAHVLALASVSEGWPKVIGEAMCYGVVCVGSALSVIPWLLADRRGATFPTGDVESLAAAIERVASDPDTYMELSRSSAKWAQRFSLESLREALRDLLSHAWNVDLGTPDLVSTKEVAAGSSR